MIDLTTVPAFSIACRGGIWQQWPITAPPIMLMDYNEALRALATVDGAVLLRVRASLGIVPDAVTA